MRGREFWLGAMFDARSELLDMLLGMPVRSPLDTLDNGRSPPVESNDPLLDGALPSLNPEKTLFLPPGDEEGDFEALLNDPCLERVANRVRSRYCLARVVASFKRTVRS